MKEPRNKSVEKFIIHNKSVLEFIFEDDSNVVSNAENLRIAIDKYSSINKYSQYFVSLMYHDRYSRFEFNYKEDYDRLYNFMTNNVVSNSTRYDKKSNSFASLETGYYSFEGHLLSKEPEEVIKPQFFFVSNEHVNSHINKGWGYVSLDGIHEYSGLRTLSDARHGFLNELYKEL